WRRTGGPWPRAGGGAAALLQRRSGLRALLAKAVGSVHRTVRAHFDALVLPHLVPDVSGPGARDELREGRIPRDPPLSRGVRRRPLVRVALRRTGAARRVVGRGAQDADRRRPAALGQHYRGELR